MTNFKPLFVSPGFDFVRLEIASAPSSHVEVMGECNQLDTLVPQSTAVVALSFPYIH
jgi:hypothetical protein